ncbi:hypothetical protein GYMLUDRAFT_49230 [Collybiopsis luxurians FD-317 M1]|uniref:Uncharacterized protein n=1 Tax=Collybiopsis luxurians FD-317 M1 TaxID=944289 RepID=A0A0D0BVI5_9AGAR|nr:hypothetical protein GYMLUDRAFT_49230 [Collybiopsis luxurians FD-317 M1]
MFQEDYSFFTSTVYADLSKSAVEVYIAGEGEELYRASRSARAAEGFEAKAEWVVLGISSWIYPLILSVRSVSIAV